MGSGGRHPSYFKCAVAAGFALAAAGFAGCGGSARVGLAPSAEAAKHAYVCGVDEVREFYCDDLVPPSPTLPAPAPFDNCPSSIADPAGIYEPAPPVAEFDASYTEYTRKRAPPGHACCYSWCSKVRLADPSSPTVQTACQTGRAFREEYCMAELESGTTMPTNPPFDRCPIAIVPPAKVVFQVPDVAVLDVTATSGRRGKGAPDCCYAWCSQAPTGSGILKAPGTRK